MGARKCGRTRTGFGGEAKGEDTLALGDAIAEQLQVSRGIPLEDHLGGPTPGPLRHALPAQEHPDGSPIDR